MSPPLTVIDPCLDLLPALRGRWLSTAEIARETGISIDKARHRVNRLDEHELVLTRPRTARRGRVAVYEFTAWSPE